MARDEFAELIASGEDSFVEFKDTRTNPADIAKEMCAFVNANGGRILIGVSDDGGMHDASEWNDERVMNVARTSIDPPIIPTYQQLRWEEGIAIAIIGVDTGAEKPYAVKSGEARRYYLRVGSTSREADREELIRLTQASGAVASDLRPVLGASLEDLNLDLVATRFAALRTVDFTDLDTAERRRILVDAEILHPDTGCPTIAGLLCYGSHPQSQLPYAKLTCVAYPNETPGGEIVDQMTADGRIDEQIERAVDFAQRNIATASDVSGVRRVDMPRPSEESLREVMANAVAHRHYGIQGPCHVRVYSNRVDVVSPGKLPNGVTPEAMRVGVSIWRNQFLVKYLVERQLVDAVGRGIVLLFEEAAETGLAPPSITTADHLTTVSLSLASK